MTYQRLTAADAAFLHLESPREPQHVGSLSVLEGGPLRDETGRIRFDEIKAHVERRLAQVPRLRQRVMEVPLSQGRPIWVDDEHFDIDHHVRLTALPRPGDDRQLATLMGRLQSLPLDRSRPLWELWMVDGMAGDDVAMIIKTHHAMGDGIANVDMALALVDLEPVSFDGDVEPIDWTPRPAPSSRRLLADSVVDQLARPLDIVRSAVGVVRNPEPFISAVGNVAKAVGVLATPPDATPWNQPVSAHRRWTHTDIPMSLVAEIRKRRDVTLNDIVLAACSGALREFLRDRDIDVDEPDRRLTAMVPVSRRGEDQHGDTLGNLISVVIIELPVAEPDPAARLETVHQRCVEAKGSGVVDGAEMMVSLADGIPALAPTLTKLLTRTIPMNLVITNIPGPPMPLYLGGARVLRTYPYVEVLDNEGLTIAVVSYDGQLFFGVTGDRDLLPDLDLVAGGIEKEFRVLVDAVIR
ncbi:MAG: wax ester/triacylglycerol synthase family O-acyltransferase [Acidimicrobiales bacterium]